MNTLSRVIHITIAKCSRSSCHILLLCPPRLYKHLHVGCEMGTKYDISFESGLRDAKSYMTIYQLD